MTDIEKAISNVKARQLGKIVGEHLGYIVIGQSESDYKGKCMSISRGDTLGFYTIEMALKINNELFKCKNNCKPIPLDQIPCDINRLSEIKTLTVNEMTNQVDIDGVIYDLISHNQDKKEITISLDGVIAIIKYS